jgi:adenylate cyclase
VPERRIAARKLAAILAADMAGYSRLTRADEEGTIARLRTVRRDLIDPVLDAHGGQMVKTTGDGFLIEFGSVVDAVRCAVALQRGMISRNRDVLADNRILFRMGINLGDVVVEGADLLGDGVNVASRLEGLAEAAASVFLARLTSRCATSSICPLTISARSHSRTSSGRCASTA